ncbi:hypothetical protein F0562_019430 [Nyssa sinensis]|uniref:Piwi domain-containing protein n=1 Tax=Nyssa sinensis TaxID=561372 RepID=A0A5J5BPN4_9ASTE|nr:hypothetical protein F0562_019430 [Nyssa sinensis]
MPPSPSYREDSEFWEQLDDLKNAFFEEEEDYKPTITFVLAQKCHHTRLFLAETESQWGNANANGNAPPGTVVDTQITHPYGLNFYLCSHYGNLGTSRPTHYYVLREDHNFTGDQLQKLIYYLCFTFALCTRSMSLVPLVYYADLVAYRGRLFQEAVIETQLDPKSTSFDDKLYKLHHKLENIMFFV